MVHDDQAVSDHEAAAAALTIDPGRSTVVLCVGSKGSGKSEAARQFFDAWPYDRVVLDVTGDARPDDPDTIAVTAPFRSQMPDPEPDEHGQPRHRVTVWARVDPRSETYEDDQNDALALGLYPRSNHALIWVDEYGELATANRIPSNLRLILNSSRHFYLSVLLCCPRPSRIPLVTMQQADLVFVFNVATKTDRQVIAENIGFPVAEFERAYQANRQRGHHAFLLWDSRQKRLFDLPPLPDVSSRGPRA